MSLIDIWIELDNEQCINSIHWENTSLEKLYAAEWLTYINQNFFHISKFTLHKDHPILVWKQERFDYLNLSCSDKTSYILLKKENKKESLYEFTLDKILNGIQIYDQNASLTYINNTSRKISAIPNHLNVTGKHLFDLYDVEEDISTVMTTLRTRAPVTNRFDNFKSTKGTGIISINTAYPIFEENDLIGAVVFEQDLETIGNQIDELKNIKKTINEKNNTLHPRKFNGYHFSDIIGSNKELLASVTLAKKMAQQDCNVLIVGETGTGKEIFAQSIHKASDRHKKKFVAINCAAVPETLIESMFFGTTKGSFTGSVDQAGLIEEADGGTLFLDELNSMSLAMQSKLLRVIQEGSVRRIGSNKDIQTNVRFISSCNEDLTGLIEQNILRKDLFFRLSTVTVEIPPLRNRLDDINELIDFYLSKNIGRYIKNIKYISPKVLALFQKYQWPGNVRELFNVLDYILNTIEGDRIELIHLPKQFQTLKQQKINHLVENHHLLESLPESDLTEASLHDALEQVEKNIIERVLTQNRFNISKSAQQLALSRQSLQYRIKKLGIIV
ncbi:sigma-54 interaction domain-containing protein [Neisseria sp. Ec49-e6-T10]|uniref:sigma-54 interaction domain-containing protein n=1 Tax=Neisseria sp. Ec49-e6-T10 TaxID=3140744 RepID=UPI003EB9E658